MDHEMTEAEREEAERCVAMDDVAAKHGDIVEIRDDGSAVWDQDGLRRIERALSTGPGPMLADAWADVKRHQARESN